MKKIILIALLSIGYYNINAQDLFKVSESSIEFTSDAPMELIEAKSEDLDGLLKPDDQTFAFRVMMTSFDGFNSALQRTHFNENYMESDKFPYAVFEGKIKEEIELLENGSHTINAEGKLNCHGVEKQRTIACELSIKDNEIIVKSDFSVMLEDHDITIPKVVGQKIAEEIFVTINLTMVPKD